MFLTRGYQGGLWSSLPSASFTSRQGVKQSNKNGFYSYYLVSLLSSVVVELSGFPHGFVPAPSHFREMASPLPFPVT